MTSNNHKSSSNLNLKTASTYLNNLLLARGLLRNGVPIHFARPHKDADGVDGTMARIINLLHDFILLRDRESSHLSTVTTSLRSARADYDALSSKISRLEARNEEISRQLAVSQAQAKAATDALKKSERETRTLREEVARAKQQTTQVRAACANDIRKRDVQIQRLKTHLSEQQRGTSTSGVSRGKRDAVGVMKIVIVPGSGNSSANSSGSGASDGSNGSNSDADGNQYDLRNESTAFLTQLSQELSDENDNLIALVRSTLNTLKEVQGLPESAALRAGAQMKENGERGDIEDHNDGKAESGNNMVHAPPMSFTALSADMEHVLDNLRNLLTNPNFVPIEEVVDREEEIQKLRSGWEKMEGKWREAMLMMDGWRKRMSEGENVNLNDIKKGLGLGRELGSRAAADAYGRRGLLSASVMAVVEDSLTELESSRILEGISESESQSESEEDEDAIECSGDFDETGHQMTTANGFTTTGGARFTRALADGDGNVHRSPRKVVFKVSTQEDAGQPVSKFEKSNENAYERKTTISSQKKSTKHSNQARLASVHSPSPSPVLFIDPNRRQRKRSSSPTPLPEEPAAKLTIQEKLNVAQAEAEAALVAAGLKLEDLEDLKESIDALQRGGRHGRGHEEQVESKDEVMGGSNDVKQGQGQDQPGKVESEPKLTSIKTTTTSKVGIRRTRITGRARRRKSTLTPQELEELMLNC